MKNLLLGIIAILFSFNSWADVKELICIEPTERRLKVLSNLDIEAAKECKSKPYGIKFVFVFDTDDFSNENASAERTKYFCFKSANHGKTVSVTIKSTPSIISFIRRGESTFNVDRKTLEAGLTTNRDLKCTIKDLDVSENVF